MENWLKKEREKKKKKNKIIKIYIYYNNRKKPIILEVSNYMYEAFMKDLYEENVSIINVGKLAIMKRNIDYVNCKF